MHPPRPIAPILHVTHIIVAAILALALMQSGCTPVGTKPQLTNYYTLEYPSPQPGNHPPLTAMIRLEPFSVAPDYNTDQIIYRANEFSRSAYHYHRWNANPAKLVHHFLQRDIATSGLFPTAITPSRRYRSDYTVIGIVDEFLEDETGDGWKAVLSLSFSILKDRKTADNNVLVQQSLTVSKDCERRSPQAMAQAMSFAMAELSSRLQEILYQAVQTDLARHDKQTATP